MYKFICKECQTSYQTPKNEAPPGIKWDDGHVCKPVHDQLWGHNERISVSLEQLADSFSPTFVGGFAQKQIDATEKISRELIDIENRIFGEADLEPFNRPLVEKLENKNSQLETRIAQLEKSIFLLRTGGISED